MNVVRVVLGFVIAVLLVVNRPVVSAVSKDRPSDPGPVYTLRVDAGTSKWVRFRLVEPRGDSIIEASQFDFVRHRRA